MLDRAEVEAKELNDEFVATEHLLIALTEERGRARDLLKAQGASKENILEALRGVRGGQRVTDQNAEDRYGALSKFAVDLTAPRRGRPRRPRDRPRRRDPPHRPGARAAARRTTPC